MNKGDNILVLGKQLRSEFVSFHAVGRMGADAVWAPGLRIRKPGSTGSSVWHFDLLRREWRAQLKWNLLDVGVIVFTVSGGKVERDFPAQCRRCLGGCEGVGHGGPGEPGAGGAYHSGRWSRRWATSGQRPVCRTTQYRWPSRWAGAQGWNATPLVRALSILNLILKYSGQK